MKERHQQALWGPGRSASRTDLIAAMFHLSHLLKAGVALTDALDDVHDMERRYNMKRVWSDVKKQVDGGRTFSEAMAYWPRFFPASNRVLVQAGEANGALASACDQCMAELQWQSQIHSRMISALLYPVLALAVLLLVVTFLLLQVVPSMHVFLNGQQIDLAWHSQALLGLSGWLQQHITGLCMGILLVLAGLTTMRLILPVGRLCLDALILRLPLLGRTVIELSLSRYASTSAHLYGSGLALGNALQLAEGGIENRALRQALEQVRHSMTAGASLGRSLDVSKELPSSFKRIVSAGETTGVLEQALRLASVQQQQLADSRIERAQQLAGPAVLLVVGACLLWIVISVLGPVYGSAIDTVLES